MKTRRIALLAALSLLSSTASAQVAFKNPAPFHVQYEMSCTGAGVSYDTKVTQSSRESCADAERQAKAFLASPTACSSKKTAVLTSSRFLSTPSCPASTIK